MITKTKGKYLFAALLLLTAWSCKTSQIVIRNENKSVPASYAVSPTDTLNTATINWRNYFTDKNLVALIDTALQNNQELNITLQEIEIARNEVRARKGEYLPMAGLKAGAGMDKAGRYTRNGAIEETLDVKPGKKFPEPLGDFMVGAYFSWEIDIWKKLRNAKNAAAARYLATIDGKNFMVTNLISEIANSYYELVALDNQMDIIRKNIELQGNVLQIIKQEKEAAKVSQLAVNRFQAQLLNTQNLQYDIQQKITESENKINFLLGRFPQPVARNSTVFNKVALDSIYAGIPIQLLENRPDIRQAEKELMAAKLDVKVARANFYPSLRISAEVGFQAFNPVAWFRPESILYSVLGDLVAPLINRNAIKASYNTAKAKQVQAIYNYEQTVLKAYIEVINQLSGIYNYSSSYTTKANEAEILTQSITISNNLFKSARADYMEVLLTQREALETKMQLIEIKQKQLNTRVNLYKALGGGWK